ncbi:glycosyltransferase 8 domain-containing protein 2 isoform X4 [Girardinichthys multiradiatus]|uniref:glycosyltransferase 8 domain-containing protein 2 isoform X4 n=1 Tax=Girardinichthys multiradiatus TaxID=208333 RepID=UPI001FABFBD8|nr:glycosyltransferase 8 domain-containing protein 2 isoform X4 [Girardinichthys multiradiatus]
MPLLKKINQVLVVLLVLLACLLLHSSLKASTQQKKVYRQSHRFAAVDLQPREAETDVVPVIICASEERTGATMATINSIISNTDASVFFYIVTLRDAVKIARRYIEKTKLKGIQYKILEFNPMVLRGKVKPDSSRPDLLHPTTYMGFLDYRKQEVKDLGINPSECSFNPGVFVADIKEWKKQKITKQLEKWMEENFRQNIYSSAMAGGVATPPMLIVFHDKYTTLDPLWHVRHLGWSPDAHYSESFLQEAHLLHWNGRFKPWNYQAVHSHLWEKWFIPDPSGRFTLTRPNSDK